MLSEDDATLKLLIEIRDTLREGNRLAKLRSPETRAVATPVRLPDADPLEGSPLLPALTKLAAARAELQDELRLWR